jgi:hypothetical protein
MPSGLFRTTDQSVQEFRSNTTRFRSRYLSRNRRPGRAVVGYCMLDYLPPRRSTRRRFDPSSSPSASLPGILCSPGDLVGNWAQ